MPVRVAVTGANSAVGRAVVRLGLSERVQVVAAVRSERARTSLTPIPESQGAVIVVSYADVDGMASAFSQAASVIHLPGLLIERADSSYELANIETTRIALEAARRAGVPKFVLVSAIGADPESPNRYFRSKGEAEALVRGSGIDYTTLRAPLILGPGTEGSRALQRRLRGGVAWLLGGGRHLQQPIDVDDLARATLRVGCDPDLGRNRMYELGGPRCLSDRRILEHAARLRGQSIRVLSLPTGLARAVARLRTRLRGPGLSPDVIDVITHDTQIDAEAAARELGLALTPLDATLRRGFALAERL